MKRRKLSIYLASLALASVAVLASCKTTTPASSTVDATSDVSSTTPVESKPAEEKKYTVTFDTMGGNSIDPVVGKAGATLSSPANPTKDSFKFEGWYKDREYKEAYTFTTIPEANITIYAKWSPLFASMISFNTNGGTTVSAIHGTEGEQITMPANPTKEGYDFVGWYTDAEFTKEFTATVFGNEVVNLYAKWNQKEGKYSVTYHVGEKTVVAYSESGNLEFEASLIADDMVLGGWYLDASYETVATEGTALTANTDVYASVYTKGLEFSADNKEVVGYTGSSSVVYVPSVYNNTKITTIGEKAFYNNNTVKTLYLPESITTVKDYAFYKAEYLVSAALTDNVTSIGAYAFANCKRLENVATIGKVEVLEASAFAGCESLTAFDLSKVKEIKDYALAGNVKIANVVLNDVTSIGAYAFRGLTNLESIDLGAKLTSIGEGAFEATTALSAINVNSENTSFKVENNALVSFDGKTLYRYFGTAEALELQYTTVEGYAFTAATVKNINCNNAVIKKGAFQDVKGLEELTIDLNNKPLAYYFGAIEATQNGTENAIVPNTLAKVNLLNNPTELAQKAFYGIRSLTTVTGLDHLTEIKDYAFAYTSVNTFNLPDTLATLSTKAFYGNTKLESFTAANNPVYKVINGAIYSLAGDELVLVPSGAKNLDFASTLRTIKAYAFEGASISSIVIPDTVTKLEKNSLTGVIGLSELVVPFIGDGAENNYLHYLFGSTKEVTTTEADGKETRKVSFDTLDNICKTLTKVTVTKPLEVIPEYAFAYFEGLEECNIQGVKTISQYAFIRTGFVDLVIPSTVENVEQFAYAYCFSLKTAKVAAQNLETGLFALAFRLDTLEFEEGVKNIPSLCCYPYNEKSTTYGQETVYSSLKNLKIASSVETIGENAFYYAGIYDKDTHDFAVEFVNKKESKLKEIGQFSFAYSALKKIELPGSLEVIGSRAFAFCDYLETVACGANDDESKLTKIGSVAFVMSKKVDNVTIYKNVSAASDLPALETWVSEGSTMAIFPFYGTNDKLRIYVPATSVEVYKTSDAYIAAGVSAKITAIK